MEQVIQELRYHVSCYHKNISSDHWQDQSPLYLLRWTHPSDRLVFAERLFEVELISPALFKEIKNSLKNK